MKEKAEIRAGEARALLQRLIKCVKAGDEAKLALEVAQIEDYLRHTHDPRSILRGASSSEKVELEITAVRSDEKLYFRMAGATAELPDGRLLSVEPAINGSGMVVTVSDDKKHRTYYFDAQAFGATVLAYENLLDEQKKLEDLNAAMNLYTPKPGECTCWKCLAGKNVAMMVLCPTCGNKLCPKASDHELECTGSNAPGQPGSVYAEEPIESLIARSSLGAPFVEPPEAELDIAVAELRRIEEESPEE